MTFASPLAVLLLQMALILVVSRAMGALFARFRQPQVIGEIIAGLMLGPSLFGWLWPTGYTSLFGDKASLTALNMLAQIGVVIFLFLVGLEFDLTTVRRHGKAAAAISVSGILVPFTLGFGLTYLLRSLFEPLPSSGLFSTALFMGAAMSVTAFPVLARIITEWRLQQTDVGSLAIAAAAVDDVLAWTMLAVVVAFAPAPAAAGAGAHTSHPAAILGYAAVFVATMFIAVRPLLKWLHAWMSPRGDISGALLAVLLITAVLSAFVTETIGVHALFGAFVAGLVMPKRGQFIRDVSLRMDSFVVVFLLPIFFAYAGLKVDLRQLLHWNMAGYTLLLTTIACVGKFGGTSIAARLTGLPTRKSLTIGALMNTRGLMELIILTVGLELGVIHQTVYGMMVVMALVTTGMAAPLIRILIPNAGPLSLSDDSRDASPPPQTQAA